MIAQEVKVSDIMQIVEEILSKVLLIRSIYYIFLCYYKVNKRRHSSFQSHNYLGSGGRIRIAYLDWEVIGEGDYENLLNEFEDPSSSQFIGSSDDIFPSVSANPGKRRYQPTSVIELADLYLSKGGSKEIN